MSNEKVMHSNQYVVGYKQTLKALNKGLVDRVIIAKDTDIHLLTHVLLKVHQMNLPIEFGESKHSLGKQYGIQVSAIVVAHLKPAL